MAKYTVLDMTQNIASALGSDEFNSISDTVESMQIAQILKNKFNDIITRADLPEHMLPVTLDPSLDPDAPVLMHIPNNVSKIEWIKYYNSNTGNPTIPAPAPGYLYVTILPPTQFLEHINSFNSTESDVESFQFTDGYNGISSNFTFLYKTLEQPKFCTVINNQFVVFDAYDSTQDSTLQSSKTMCLAQVVPIFKMEDNFIPDLNDQQFPLLINEAKALAFYELKQTPHVKAEQEIKRQWSAVGRNKSIDGRPSYFDQLPNFGRVGSNFVRTTSTSGKGRNGL